LDCKTKIKGESIVKIAESQKINRRCVYQILEKYKQDSWKGLKNHKTGHSQTQLNQKAEIIILELRKRFAYGACRIEELLKKKGFSISHGQIECKTFCPVFDWEFSHAVA